MAIDDSPGDDNRMAADEAQPHRRIRSYVLRAGRMTEAQQRGFDEGWTRWGIDYRPEVLDLPGLFESPGKRVLEIGFGMGQSLVEMAAAAPDSGFIGIEVHRAGVGKLLHELELRRLQNLRVICHDAVEVLEHMLAPSSLDRIQIYFPDPWHKKRHHKRRLIQPDFAALLTSRLCPGGLLHLATDWEPYAEHMLEVLNVCVGLKNCAEDGRYVPRPAERPSTKFEKRGERLGHGVQDLLYRRTA
jgi:tRNA (guanine-N7-)-methyltransferase